MDAERADRAAAAQRLAPAMCAAGAAGGAVTESPLVLAAFAVTAFVGAVGPHHPFESVYNRWAGRRRRPTLPPNRAAKKLGCAIGAGLLAGAAGAYIVGAATLGFVLAAVLGATATFVALTAICIPSMIFTAVWGVERACRPNLLGSAAKIRRDSRRSATTR